jgi:hypothetical protein
VPRLYGNGTGQVAYVSEICGAELMLIITPKELIETLKHYKEDEPLLITWWSAEDVEMIATDEVIETDRAKEVWDAVIDDLDNNTSDYVISHVNDELDSLVYKRLQDSK